MKAIKVLLVDDQTLFIESLKTVLETYVDNIQVMGLATDGTEALNQVKSGLPDVVLMDVRMPNLNGVECTKIIKSKYPKVKVLMLTTFDNDEYVFEALRCGAEGYLLKDMPPVELISSIQHVYNGGVPISPKITPKLINYIWNSSQEDNMERNWLETMSDREKEILKLIAKGFDNKVIAKRLFLKEQTVKNYVSVIYSKMRVKDRVQAARLAIKAGMG